MNEQRTPTLGERKATGWSDPARRRRGIFNVTTTSAVFFTVQGAALGGTVAVVLGRTQPAGSRQTRPHPARGAAIGAAGGGLFGVLSGLALGALVAIVDIGQRNIDAHRAVGGTPLENETTTPENETTTAVDTALSGTGYGSA